MREINNENIFDKEKKNRNVKKVGLSTG